MSKDILYAVIAFASGILVGGGITYAHISKKYQRMAQEDINEMKAFYNDKLKEAKVHATIYNEMKAFYNVTDEALNLNESVHLREKFPGEDISEDVSEFVEVAKPYTSNSIDLDRMKERLTPPTTEELIEAASGPYVISEESYFEECTHHDKTSVVYYQEDGVVCDEKENPVDNEEDLLGREWLEQIGPNKDTVYVRNDKISADFEINFDANSFAESVWGMSLEDAESMRRSHRGEDS